MRTTSKKIRGLAGRGLFRAVGLVLVVALGLGSAAEAAALVSPPAPAPAPAAAVTEPTPETSAVDAIGTLPGIQYEEALKHASDPNTFTPGARVTLPFTPRATDRRSVGGAPKSLPAGRASGSQMAASPNGSVWANTGTVAPVDAPWSDQGAIPAIQALAVLPGTTDPGVVEATTAGSTREIFGFLPYWEVSDSSTVLNYDVLTTIAYFGVGADASGNLQKTNSDGTLTTGWGGWTSSKMTNVITAAHQKGTRVVMTVEMFAWTSSQATNQASFLSNASAQLNLAEQIAAAVRDRGADGVNLDFEPIVSSGATGFVSFVRTLRQQLDAVAPGYQLTYDNTGEVGNYLVGQLTAAGAADAVLIMGYDYRIASASNAGSIAPLVSSLYDLTDTVKAFTALAPASKIILALPWYGRAWSTVSNAPNAATQGSSYPASVTAVYDTAVGLAATNGRNYDSTAQSPWTAYLMTSGGVTTWRELYYDDSQSLQAKYDLINGYQLRGTGIWALGYDGARPELYQALASKFITDTTPPLAGVTPLPATEADQSFTVGWQAIDNLSTIGSYDVQVSTNGGAWAAWLTGTTATSGSFNGADGHTYAFRVRATDSKGNAGSWNITNTAAGASLAPGGFASVVTSSLNMRASASTSATILTTLPLGTLLNVTGAPVSAGGYTWYPVSGPLTTWGPVTPVTSGWVAAASGSTPYIQAAAAPNVTTVHAGIGDLALLASGVTATGSASDRLFSPNGDGTRDGLGISWSNRSALNSLTLKVYTTTGTLVGSQALPVGVLGATAQSWGWDGKLGGSAVADGTYVLRLVGMAGASTFEAPFSGTPSSAEIAAWAVTIDTTDPALTLNASGTSFSPNADGFADTITISGSAAGATSWRLTASLVSGGAPGSPIRTMTGSTSGSISATWDGLTDGGTKAPDGSYSLALTAWDAAGNGSTKSFAIAINTTISGATYVALPAPVRVLDTRTGTGLSGKFSANYGRNFQVTGIAGIPSNAIAVTGNVTVRDQTYKGWIGITPVAPPGNTAPGTSNLNFPAGDVRSDGVTVSLSTPAGSLGATYVAPGGNTANISFDVTGYFVPDTSGSTYKALPTPARVLDTRSGNGLSGAFVSGTPRTFQVGGRGGLPTGVVAVTGNLTVTNQTSSGSIALVPSAGSAPGLATLNFPLGDVRANGVTIGLSGTGTLTATFQGAAGATAQVVFDVTGYFVNDGTGAVYLALPTPARLLDSRYGVGVGGAFRNQIGQGWAVAGRGGVPGNAIAVTGTVAVVNQTAKGYVSVIPNVANGIPPTSTINFPLGDVRANATTVLLGTGGTLAATYVATTGATTQLVFDVTGYYIQP